MSTGMREKRKRISNAADFGRVAVLLGGSSSERKVSLETGTAVLTALLKRGVDAVAWDPAEHGMRNFSDRGFDRAWIALHGAGGEDGSMQGALQCLGTPYTGSGVMASALAMDKVRSKHLFRAVGVTTPDFEVIHLAEDARAAADRLGYPLVLKPAGQGSSVGMSKVFEASELAAAAKLALGFGDPAIVERCITGDEITVAVLQGEALPSIRIVTPRIFYDYKAKYEADTTQYFCPGTDDAKLEKRYRDIAMRAFEALGCSGWGRVDLMASNDGVLQVLEVNTVPGMTSHSLVPMAGKAAGIDFAELCWRILETSFARANEMPAMGVAANDA
jgi:D-alanine-D-alanine ligase